MCLDGYDDWKTAENPDDQRVEALIDMLYERSIKNGTSLDEEIEKYNQEEEE